MSEYFLPSYSTPLIDPEIEKMLPLQQLRNDFNFLVKFLRLARCGVVGHVDLQIAVREELNEVVMLCDDTVHTLHEFERVARSALRNMQLAYEYLEADLEDETLDTLKDVISVSKNMEGEVLHLCDRCKKESVSIRKVGSWTIKKKSIVSQQIKKAISCIAEQKYVQQYNEETFYEEGKAAIESRDEIKSTIAEKQQIFEIQKLYTEEEQHQLVTVREGKQRKINVLQSKLNRGLEDMRLALKRQLDQNKNNL